MTQQIIEARSDILDEATIWMANNSWMSDGRAPETPGQERNPTPRLPAPLRVVVCIMLLLFLVPERVAAQQPPVSSPLSGHWRFEETGEILEMFACRSMTCARIAALAPGETQTRDTRNPSETQRSRRLCGLTVIRDLRPHGERLWRRGDAYSPEDGHTYDVRISRLTDGRISMRAAIRGFPLLAQTYFLERVPAPPACAR